MRSLLRSCAVLVVGASVFAGGDLARDALAIDGATQNPDNGHWYAVVTQLPVQTWPDCKTAAEAQGGYLATVTSSAEHLWILQNLSLATQSSYWLGATDAASEGTWVWITGEAWTISNWDSGEPNNCCGGEHWLQMSGSGPWNDNNALFTQSGQGGYILEWNTDPAVPVIVEPPSAPMQLFASYSETSGVTLTWNDTSSNEDGFRIERRPAGYTFSHRYSTGASTTSYVDQALFPSTTYTYRVRAFNSGGDSAWTNEASVTTVAGQAVPSPPKAPSYLTAAPDSAAIELVWTDNSADETFFDLERAAGGAAFQTAVRVTSDVVDFADEPVYPGWPYTYRVRALALQGPSPWSNTAAATTVATLDVTVVAGTLADSKSSRRDKLKLSATYSFPPPNADRALDLLAHGLELQLGSANAPVPVSIAAGDATWKVRKGKATWKSPKGASPKVTVVVDTVRRVLTASVSAADFSSAPTALVGVLLGCGPDGGVHSAAWTKSRTGFSFP